MSYATKSSGLDCPECGKTQILRHLPKEVDRQLFHEEITVPAESGLKKLRVAILRVTYRRNYLCQTCGYQWSQTYTTESQKHV
jgi:predicted RNA-binding Zn-ribbon protein involved in translation (DUF1610 family)